MLLQEEVCRLISFVTAVGMNGDLLRESRKALSAALLHSANNLNTREKTVVFSLHPTGSSSIPCATDCSRLRVCLSVAACFSCLPACRCIKDWPPVVDWKSRENDKYKLQWGNILVGLWSWVGIHTCAALDNHAHRLGDILYHQVWVWLAIYKPFWKWAA